MGQIVISKLTEPLHHCSHNVTSLLIGHRKRKRSIDSNSNADDLNNGEVQTPKKKKLLTTTQYIYQALFKEEKSSDISVMALGKVWNLHKIYLSQSPYFYSMFNGSWKESCQDFVHIKILDDLISTDALDAVFGSMYSDEIEIDPKLVVSVLATATLFHMESIIEKCSESMIEHINADSAVQYYEAACRYGCLNVKKAAFKWLETNLLSSYGKQQQRLRQISISLMTSLITSPDLYVMQTEFSIYTLLRTWMYLQLHPNFNPDDYESCIQQEKEQQQELLTDESENTISSTNPTDIIQTYYSKRQEKRSFLATPEGQPYIKVFQALRTQYLTNHHMDLKIVLNENIIPKEWLHNHVLHHWDSILRVDHMPEEGPQNLDAEVFYKNCMRCGRVLLEPGYQKWRWTGFNFGLDLILVADSRLLSIRRHHRNEHERLLSLQTKRQFMIRTSVTSVNAQRQPIFTQTTDIMSLNLEKNEEATLLVMNPKLVHPLFISVNLLVVPPSAQFFKNLLTIEESHAGIPISEIGGCLERPTTPNESQRYSVYVMQQSPHAQAHSAAPQQQQQSQQASSSSSTSMSTGSMCSAASAAE